MVNFALDGGRPRLVRLFSAHVMVLLALATQSLMAQARHPLDSLTAEEIKVAAKALSATPQFPAGALFSTIVLKEPLKSEVLSYKPGAQISRQAFAVILDRKGNHTFEAVVDLKPERVVAWKEAKGIQPLVMDAEYKVLPDIVKADSRWQAAMRNRGITDFDKVQIDGWAVGQVQASYQGMRLLRALSYLKGDSINFYGRPIEGVVALVNMNTDQVLEVVDTGVVPLAPAS